VPAVQIVDRHALAPVNEVLVGPHDTATVRPVFEQYDPSGHVVQVIDPVEDW